MYRLKNLEKWPDKPWIAIIDSSISYSKKKVLVILRVSLDFYIKNADNEIVQNLKSGSDYKFTLTFQNNCYPEIFNSVIVSYALIDNKNQLVFLVRSNFTNENIDVKTKSCSVTCEIKDLALANGEYSLTAFIGYGEDKTYDLVENVVTVTVTGGDYFKTKSHGLPLICKNLTRAKFILEL